jgi:general secretion pathway protein E
MVDAVITAAESVSASDLHAEPTGTGLTIRFRLDGVVQPVASLPRAVAPMMIARLKVLADLLTYRTDIPQEGGVRRDLGCDLRISTFPTIHGEKAVVRFFGQDADLRRLDQLGLSKTHHDRLAAALTERTGAILLTGASGSGKTTTVYACLDQIVRTEPGRQVVTIEDPVERVVPGVVQSQVKPGSDFDFARGLRSLLRQDPEVIAVGEIRDRETAAIAVEAALTGHLMLSTLHAGSAAGAVSRLLEMGLESYLITSSLRGILNQRLLRKCCTTCAGRGCQACSGSGFRGRVLIAEWFEPTAAVRSLILARADRDAITAAANEQSTLLDAARDAVARGVTTVDEARRVMGESFIHSTKSSAL